MFFEKYSQMDRSKEGLAGAGEWETLKELLPDFTGKRMLDLGCGYGWHCIYAMEHGAASAVGIDISRKMLEVAREKTPYPQVEYRCTAMEDMEFPRESFDIALSSPGISIILNPLIRLQKSEYLFKAGGQFPVFSGASRFYGLWDPGLVLRRGMGEILHFPVDNYYYEGKRTANFLGEEVGEIP